MFHAMEIESGCNGLSPWIWTPLIPLHRLHGNLFQRKHLNGRSWLIFAYPPSVFGSDLKYHLIQHKQEPLHFHRGFACAQSPVSWGVEFAIKWVGEGFFYYYFLPKNCVEVFFVNPNDCLLFTIPLLSHSCICSLEVKSCEKIDYKWEIIAEEWEGGKRFSSVRHSTICWKRRGMKAESFH